MSFDPFESKHAKSILKRVCKGKSLATLQKTFQTVVDAKMTVTNLNTGGVSIEQGEQCLALAEVVAVGRGNAGKVELPVIAEDWLAKAPEFDDALAESARAAAEKVRTNSASWSIAYEMGGWPEWTGYCRGLCTRLKKPARNRKAAPKADGIGAVIKRLRAKHCRLEKESGHVVELRCTENGQIIDADLADIIQLTKLRVLVLETQSVTDKGLATLSALRQLRELELDQCKVKGPGFRNLKLPKLQKLSFGRSGVNVALANAHHLTGLREVSFFGSDITDKGLQELNFARSLESIGLSQCQKLNGTGFRGLAGLKKLREIEAVRLPFSAAGFAALCELTSLRKLELLIARLPAKDINRLANLKRLEYLSLGSTSVSDEQLEFLGGLRKLKELNLSGNRGIADATVGHISKLSSLEELSLSSTSVTAESLEMLSKMKLTDVDLSATKISRAAQKKLERSLRG